MIYSKTLEEYLLHIFLVLDTLINIRMTIDEKKYYFTYISIELLEYRVSYLDLST
jgi:hypothetical protein